uniref:GP46-like surface antigen n=1 Tax=Mesocestoides corti TaxID=53468 RepID=A0A5K3F4Q1_MESCO
MRWKAAVQAIYIFGATLLTCSLLLEGIFIRLLLVPYLRESNFLPTHCIILDTYYPTNEMRRCDTRLPKLTSAFPCLVRQPYWCSIRPCHLRTARNAMIVRTFNWSLVRTHAFPCYLQDNVVILNKLWDLSTTSHALLWPVFTALLSVILIFLNWRFAGRRGWRQETNSP